AVRIGVPALAMAVLLHVGYRRVGLMPALGPFLDPVHGVWATGRQPDVPPSPLVIPGADSVEIVVDDRGVPHVWARSLEDAARALGYLHAYHRLFQMELQARAAAGELTEWIGRSGLGLDRDMRSLGLAWAAERDLARLVPASDGGRALAAYAEGVNARIDALGAGDLPFEYRLLGTQPRRWSVVHSLLFAKQMGYTLSYMTPEIEREQVASVLGPEVAEAIVPVDNPLQEPIVPSRRAMPALDPIRLPPAPVFGAPQARGAVPRSSEHREASNNWVVSGARTAAGFPLLAGDPHLELTLPAIWYEAHVTVPGIIDAYGVTFPGGGPAVAIGFNRDVAWSFTNTGADILDFYEETVDDPAGPTQYMLDGGWQPLESRIEEYRDRTGAVLAIDTVYYTHRGPVQRPDGRFLSLRWVVLESDNTLGPLWRIGQAHSVDEWIELMRPFRGPVQNGVVADRAGNIAVLSAGAYPVRPPGTDGLTVFDGATSASDWQGYLPPEAQPFARNPDQGYIASANQQPVDPRTSTAYLGGDWPTPWRAMRINELLRRDTAVTPAAMAAFQTDPGSVRADWFAPAFVDAALSEAAAGRADGDAETAAQRLAEWDRRYTRDNERAVLFEEAMRQLRFGVWDELTYPADASPLGDAPEALLAALLAAPTHPWWDDHRTTDVVETRDAMLARALGAAFRRTVERYGAPDQGGWRWDGIRHANIWHPLRVEALSELGVPVQGGNGTLNPSSGWGTHGASWRMVVELGPEVRAWGVYPGGQSGNPLSRWYRDRIRYWSAGVLDTLPFP
ncbi:MAG: penicillin acylase family protein, partial [Synechococcaceae cyanobacterium]|nr:penicillin acylase family protein [Synechococcaceae cyanobacterium]